MMKNIAIINNVDFGSTGQISLNLHRNLGNYIQSYSLKPLKSYKFSN